MKGILGMRRRRRAARLMTLETLSYSLTWIAMIALEERSGRRYGEEQGGEERRGEDAQDDGNDGEDLLGGREELLVVDLLPDGQVIELLGGVRVGSALGPVEHDEEELHGG